MSIKEIVKNGKRVGYDVQVSARHPITREKKYLRRVAPNKWEANQLEVKLKNELQAIHTLHCKSKSRNRSRG